MQKLIMTEPTITHQDFKDAICNTMASFEDQIPSLEMMAILSYILGSMIALQDAKTFTSEMAVNLVHENLFAGNAEANRVINEETPNGG